METRGRLACEHNSQRHIGNHIGYLYNVNRGDQVLASRKNAPTLMESKAGRGGCPEREAAYRAG
jgi:hypothetical protein